MSLAKEIAGKMGISQKEALIWVQMIFKILSETLSQGQSVKIYDFGHFMLKEKKS